MKLQWKHYWAALGYVVTSGFGIVPAALDMPVAGGVSAAVAGGAAWLIGRHELHANPLFQRSGWEQDLKTSAVQLLGTDVAARVAWTVGFDAIPHAWPGWMAALLLVTGGELGAEQLLERAARRRHVRSEQLARQAEQHTPEVVPAQAVTSEDLGELPAGDELEDGEYQRVLRIGKAIFARAGLGAVELDRWSSLGDSGVVFEAQIPDQQHQSVRKKQRVEALSNEEHGEALAIAAGRQLQVPVESSWVQIYKERQAGRYSVSLLVRDALADVHEYVDEPDARPSIHDPCPVGWRSDQQSVALRLDQHGFQVGKSQSGKSLFMHRLLARVTQCRDAVQWVGGTAKLYDLVADWVEPFEGTGVPCPIDWIANGPQDTAEMLAAACRIAADRQNQRKSERTGWKAIKITLDESSEALNHPSCFARFEGKRRSGSWLYARLSRTAKSAKIYLDRATQRGVQDSDGTHGGDIQANTDYTVAFQTNDPQELGRATGQFKLQQPPHPGCYWIRLSSNDAPELAKGLYIQESDPSKKRLHEGQTIRDIAWSRRHCDNELDERAQEAAGAAYQERFRFVNAAMLDYLCPAGADVDEDDEDGDGEDATPEGGGREEAQAALAAVPGLSALLEQGHDSMDGEDDGPVAAPRTWRELIVQTVQYGDGGPLSRAALLERLRGEVDELNEQSVDNALGRLVGRGELVRDEVGYRVPAPAAVA